MISSSYAFLGVQEGKEIGKERGKLRDTEGEWAQGLRATVKHGAVVADKCFFSSGAD